MSIVQVLHAASRKQYESVASALGLADAPPVGQLCHIAAETPSGEVLVIDVWASVEQKQAFEEQRLFPAFHATGNADILVGGPPEVLETFVLELGAPTGAAAG